MSNESVPEKIDIARQYADVLQGMYGVPIESKEPLAYTSRGLEHLYAEPTRALELFPDAIGSLRVVLPLPGEEIAAYPCVEITESTATIHKETKVFPVGSNLRVKSLTRSQRDYKAQCRTNANGLPLPFWPQDTEIIESRDLPEEEGVVVLDWLKTVVPKARPRPISLMNVASLSSRSEEEAAFDVMTDAERLELAVATVLDEVDARNYLKIAHVNPSQATTELTGTKKITIFDDAFDQTVGLTNMSETARFPMVSLSPTDGSSSRGEVTLYPKSGKIWMQRGDAAITAEKYHVALGGVTIMSGITDSRPGLPPLALNPRQADGVVAMLMQGELDQDLFKAPKRWDEL